METSNDAETNDTVQDARTDLVELRSSRLRASRWRTGVLLTGVFLLALWLSLMMLYPESVSRPSFMPAPGATYEQIDTADFGELGECGLPKKSDVFWSKRNGFWQQSYIIRHCTLK